MAQQAKFRVTYPLITQDGHRDFDTREKAEAFAQERRNNPGRYQTCHSWRMVKVEQIDCAANGEAA